MSNFHLATCFSFVICDQTRIEFETLINIRPFRLAGLAADLARVSSSARHATGAENVAMMLEESQYFIEWTAAEAETEVAGELVDIQRLIALWRKAWPKAQQDSTQRTLLSVTTKKWSDQVLGYSGIV